jgi:hypothetical protein
MVTASLNCIPFSCKCLWRFEPPTIPDENVADLPFNRANNLRLGTVCHGLRLLLCGTENDP